MPVKHFIAAASAAAVVTATLPAASSAATVARVEQGAFINIENQALCTVGYNDKGSGNSYTAAHCGQTGDRVRLLNADNEWVDVGTLVRSRGYVDDESANDWAEIRWDSGAVDVGENLYTGDNVISLGGVEPGDTVCRFGAITNKTACGEVIGKQGQNVYWDDVSGQPGDSGGPVWVPGQGLVAIYSGMNVIESLDLRAERASAPADGPVIDENQTKAMILDYFQAPEAEQEVIAPVHEDVGSALSSNGGGAAAAIAVLLALLAVFLPLLQLHENGALVDLAALFRG